MASFKVEASKLTFIQVAKDPLSLYFQGPTMVILMEQGYALQRVNGEYFAKAHGLTAAETIALSGIIAGKSVDEIAGAAALSPETIRSLLKMRKQDPEGNSSSSGLVRASLLPG